jgi:CRISPR/Cas system-associated exonuclease Cas4 (RecB family)
VGDRRDWTSPSDLAEFAFCPRAHYYRQRLEAPETPATAAGERDHERRLGAERWRDEHGALAWLAVVAGLALLGLAGFLWR